MPRPDHSNWIKLVDEPIIDPERRIIDPHHHFWIEPNIYGGSYQLEELWADTGSGHKIEATVFVQCGAEHRKGGPKHLRPVGETEFVARLARASAAGAPDHAVVKGIVAHVDLRLEPVLLEEAIEAHKAAANGLLKGIRDGGASDPDPAMQAWPGRRDAHHFEQESFHRGFASLAAHSLTFDAWVYYPQMPQVTALARRFEETTIVLNHFGGVLGIGRYEGRRDEILREWKENIRALAACPNVVVKLGGLAMPINGYGWHERDRPATSDELVAAHRDYYLFAIDQFGPARCMFESNFPVEKLSVSYPVYWNAAKKLATGFSEEEKDCLFYGTAKRIYLI